MNSIRNSLILSVKASDHNPYFVKLLSNFIKDYNKKKKKVKPQIRTEDSHCQKLHKVLWVIVLALAGLALGSIRWKEKARKNQAQ